jgi:hypothetical protein
MSLQFPASTVLRVAPESYEFGLSLSKSKGGVLATHFFWMDDSFTYTLKDQDSKGTRATVPRPTLDIPISTNVTRAHDPFISAGETGGS